PTLAVLRECLKEVEGKSSPEAEMRQRLEAMLEFVEMVTSLYTQVSALPTGAIKGLLSAQGKVRSLLGGGAGSGQVDSSRSSRSEQSGASKAAQSGSSKAPASGQADPAKG